MNRRFIVLDIQLDYPLENIKPHIFYRITLEISKENRRYFYIFILNGNFYFENLSYRKKELMTLEDSLEVYYCCSIEKVKRFITKSNISHLLKRDKKINLETIDDLRIVLMECGYKREIKFNEFHEAERELKSDFSKWHKYDDFHFISKKLNPNANPGDVKLGSTPFGSTIILDMISDRRKQKVPDCIKEEIIYWTNTMLDEKLADIESVCFLLHAEIAFEVIGSLFKSYKVYIIMADKSGNQLHKNNFCLCDCEKNRKMLWRNILRRNCFLIDQELKYRRYSLETNSIKGNTYHYQRYIKIFYQMKRRFLVMRLRKLKRNLSRNQSMDALQMERQKAFGTGGILCKCEKCGGPWICGRRNTIR